MTTIRKLDEKLSFYKYCFQIENDMSEKLSAFYFHTASQWKSLPGKLYLLLLRGECLHSTDNAIANVQSRNSWTTMSNIWLHLLIVLLLMFCCIVPWTDSNQFKLMYSLWLTKLWCSIYLFLSKWIIKNKLGLSEVLYKFNPLIEWWCNRSSLVFIIQ